MATQPSTSSFEKDVFFSTVRIEAYKSPTEMSIGTGFCFGYEDKQGEMTSFIVTNRHVVANYLCGCLYFHKELDGAPSFQPAIKCPVASWNAWFCHPDPSVDVAILPTENNILGMGNPFTRLVSSSLLLNDDEPHPLAEIFFIGYPDGLWDEAHALPIARRGITASFINQDYNGRPCFLIDASVFSGSSGSPVFLLSSKLSSREPGTISWGKRCYFIGVVAETQLTLAQTLKVNVPQQTLPAEHLNLGIVFKARTVIETIEAWKKSTEK